jgi:hypothetical protein
VTRDAPSSFLGGVGDLFARLGPTGATANARDAIAERMHVEYSVAALERRLTASAPPVAERKESRTA